VADLLDHPFGGHLVRKLGDDDLLLPGRLLLFDRRPGPDDDAPTPLLVALLDPVAAVDNRARGTIGPPDELAHILEGGRGAIDEVVDRLDRLAEVVGGDVGRHPYRDPRRSVD